MLKGFFKVSVLGFMVNGMDNFCFATFSDGPSSLGSSASKLDEEELKRDRGQLSKILEREVEDYGTLDEVNEDLRLLDEIKDRYRNQEKVWRLPLSGMNLKREELGRLSNIENIRNMKSSVYTFLNQKWQQYKKREKYKKEIEKIYGNQGMSDTEEEMFYKNVVFLNQVRKGGLYKSEEQELFREINELLKGIFFWEKRL